jgi:hypothetical protein
MDLTSKWKEKIKLKAYDLHFLPFQKSRFQDKITFCNFLFHFCLKLENLTGNLTLSCLFDKLK